MAGRVHLMEVAVAEVTVHQVVLKSTVQVASNPAPETSMAPPAVDMVAGLVLLTDGPTYTAFTMLLDGLPVPHVTITGWEPGAMAGIVEQ